MAPLVVATAQRPKHYLTRSHLPAMTETISREDDSNASASGTPPDRKCCMGVLYFSQKLHENGRSPVSLTNFFCWHADVHDIACNGAAAYIRSMAGAGMRWDQDKGDDASC